MKFQFYGPELDAVPKLSVDGTVPNSIHFSHWQGNETPFPVKADTSTEIALNLVAAPNRNELTRGIDLVTNNHFDTDGVLSVWTVLAGERALELRDRLIPAAEAGDFCELNSAEGVRASIVIQGPDQASASNDSGSPLARHLSGEAVSDDARTYELVLPEVERVLTRTDDYEPLWRSGWTQIEHALASFERGSSAVEEIADARLSLIILAPEAFGSDGFDPMLHATPFTVISRHAHGRIFLIATAVKGGWFYRIDYPYYSWAETIVRPRIERCDFSNLLEQLNQIESNSLGRWQLDTYEMTSAVKFLNRQRMPEISSLKPETVTEQLRAELLSLETAVAKV